MSSTLTIKRIAAVVIAVAMIFGAYFAVSAVKVEALTEAQITSILGLLSSFGVDAATYANVEASLRGQPTPGAGSGTGTSTGVGLCGVTFTQNFDVGDSSAEVMQIQKFLNSDPDTQIASAPDAGAPGFETSYFGSRTQAAVIKFQDKYTSEILAPVGLTAGTGFWGPSSRAKANAINAGSCSGGGTTTPPPATGGGVSVSSPAQPAASLAPELAARVPFTKVTLTAGASDVTVNSITVERTGLAADAAFSGVVLLDEDGTQIGIAKTFNSNHQANVGTDFVIKAGTSKTLTIGGNMVADNSTRAGQVASITVVGINTTATVSGSLPITGAGHTINASLTIGTVTANLGVNDPNTSQTKEIGTTGYTFQSVRLTAGSAEDVRLHSIRWNQTGSAGKDDLANVVVVVDGVEYPATVSSDGKYYTASFGNGIVIQKGFSKDVSIKADIISGPNRTVIFDIDKDTDIHAVGELFGYGITATAGSTAAASTSSSQFTTGTPFFDGATVTIDAGSVSTVSKDTNIPAQNVAINVPNEPIGGFTADIKGEEISVGKMVFFVQVTGTGDPADLTNVTLVDQNGSVIAGPVDGAVVSGKGGSLTFTDTVTFPTGVTKFQLKGQYGTDFVNNDTVVASTTPSVDWTTVTGQTTGNTISLSSLSTAVAANTMTVKSATTTVTVSSDPSSQNVVAGVAGFTFANYQFDGTESGEDVRYTTAQFNIQTDTGASYPTNCFAWDGATRLNNSAINPSADGATTFTFDNALTVPKGTVKNVALKCDVPASSTTDDTVEWKLASAATLQGVGVNSAQTITATHADSVDNQNKLTIKAGGALTVEKDASSPSLTVVSAGTSGTTLGVLKLRATNEDISMNRIGLQLTNTASSSAADLVKIELFDGATKVAEGLFTAGNTVATTTFTSNFIVPKDGEKVLTIKGNLASVGTSQPGNSGALIAVDYDGDRTYATEGTGQSSGTSVTSGSTSDTAVSGVRMFKSFPTFAKVALPSNTLANGERSLLRFSVTADSAGAVGLYKFTLRLATTTATVDSLNIYAYTDSGFSTPVSGVSNDGGMESAVLDLETLWASSATDLQVYANDSAGASTTVQVPSGGTRYFDVRATVSGSSAGASVSTQLQGDADYFATDSTTPFTDTALVIDADADNDFIWSPNSTTTTDDVNDDDWTNGYSLVGLPSSNMTPETISQ